MSGQQKIAGTNWGNSIPNVPSLWELLQAITLVKTVYLQVETDGQESIPSQHLTNTAGIFDRPSTKLAAEIPNRNHLTGRQREKHRLGFLRGGLGGLLTHQHG